ncbi:MAG: right-handed parallel beta-helix repeat-containing protein [Alphaproteobacteria bacterium]|nr:right-handed parallel beta-helix repeat-containing protein [Alphaproteobacteria bacterium]
MNKAITDGVVFMPTAFSAGLALWSNQDGTPGSTNYTGVPGASVITADSDFGTCLEIIKASATQKLRYMVQTPLLPGCYIKVSARVKAVSGNLPSVQIAGWAGDAAGAHVPGVVETGSSTLITAYGEVLEVWAIIGAGNRTGVDMVWGSGATFGHFGLDFTGANGGIIRIEDVRIEDATNVFYRKLMDWVDVCDYGAIGDGVTDDSLAFEAADLDAKGRDVLVSDGVYHLANHVTFESRVRFEGTVTMPTNMRLALTKNYDLPTYIDAFVDPELALQKALQTLMNFSDHDSLDMCGRRILLTKPLDVHAAVVNRETFATRRVLRNGQLRSDGSAAWNTETFTSLANYNAALKTELSNVANISQIPVGSLVEGTGVGREIYVKSVNIAAGTLQLNLPLFGAPAQQTYTFKRFKYLLDFSGFTSLHRFTLANIDFFCEGQSNGVMLAKDGLTFLVKDCYFTRPRERGITSIGGGCSGMQLDRNQFISNEQTLNADARISIGFNVNANDVKIRDNRGVRFRHFGVIHGTGQMIEGNHFYQGDNVANGLRTAGIVMTSTNPKSVINGNYIDNCFVSWSNEHDETPDAAGTFSFGSLSIIGNIFMSNGSASWFRFIQIKPHGVGHFINGLNVSGNTFKHINGGTIDRVEAVDASIAPMDASKFRNLIWEGNTYNNVVNRTFNPVTIPMEELTTTQTWPANLSAYLPFGGKARHVVSVMAENKIKTAANLGVYTVPYAVTRLGATGSEIMLHWSEPVKGKVYTTVRVDNPV